MNELRKVSSNPHIRMHISTQMIMLCVIIALLPTTIFGIWNFGLHALVLILVTIASTVLGEWIFDLICKKDNTITDLSAVVTGLLLALNLPPRAPRCNRWSVCHHCCEDVIRWTWTEFYESGVGCQMLFADLIYVYYDEF